MDASPHTAQSPATGETRPPTRRWKFAFALITIVLMYVITEVVLFAAVSLRFGRMFSFTEMEAARREIGAGPDPFGQADVPARLRIHKEIVHPYMGYVYDPRVEQSSPYGVSDVSPIQHRSPGKVIIGIFGGSFADDIAYNAGEALADLLKPRFPGKQFVVVKATIGGYKQPQQLMALNYFTALGGEFDIVINLDGFNEVALPAQENVPQTNPFFPRQWHLRMRTVPDQQFLETLGRVKFLDSVSAKWASTFRKPTAPLQRDHEHALENRRSIPVQRGDVSPRQAAADGVGNEPGTLPRARQRRSPMTPRCIQRLRACGRKARFRCTRSPRPRGFATSTSCSRTSTSMDRSRWETRSARSPFARIIPTGRARSGLSVAAGTRPGPDPTRGQLCRSHEPVCQHARPPLPRQLLPREQRRPAHRDHGDREDDRRQPGKALNLPCAQQ